MKIFKIPLLKSFKMIIIWILILNIVENASATYNLSSYLPLLNLRQLNVHEDSVTLSGFSAGSSMATQLHVTHSSLFHGVALFSQGFYRCGAGSLAEFMLRCSIFGLGVAPYNIRRSLMDARMYESQGLIDPLKNLQNQRVFIFMGLMDEFVPLEMVTQNVEFYNALTSKNVSIHLQLFKAKHLFPTLNFGPGCEVGIDAKHGVFLGNCNYSGAYHSLEFLLRDKIALVSPPAVVNLARLRLYNQSEFYSNGDIRNIGLGSAGFIYIPTKCQDSKTQCFLHVHLHGCKEWMAWKAEIYIQNSGYLEISEVNNIIFVFPLTTRILQNKIGCWDFFSYTGKNFATKEGPQIKVVTGIINRLIKGI